MGPAAVRRKGKGMGISGMVAARGKSSKHRVSSGRWPMLCEAVRTDSRFVGDEPVRENSLAGHVPEAWPARPWSDVPITQAEAVPFMEEIMDDLKKKGAADRNKINLHEPWEVDHWTWLLHVSKDELQGDQKKSVT
jgi:hypothetical protein